MARPSATDWERVRAAWEADKRQRLAWLTLEGGGPWPVSADAIRRWRRAEGWAKHAVMRARLSLLGERHRGMADRARAERAAGMVGDSGCIAAESAAELPEPFETDFDFPFGCTIEPDASEEDEVDIRRRLIRQHRADWAILRRLLNDIVRAADPADSRVARVANELLRSIQEGESRVRGLDVDLIDYEALTDEQLEYIIKHGRLPR